MPVPRSPTAVGVALDMLVIRPEQMKAFQLTRELEFKNWLVRFLLQRASRMALPVDEPVLRERVSTAMAAARRFQITGRRDVFRFVQVCAIMGWDVFDRPENDWMARMLTDSDVAVPTTRLAMLYDELSRRLEVRETNHRRREKFLAG
jgi:hypothetical protein